VEEKSNLTPRCIHTIPTPNMTGDVARVKNNLGFGSPQGLLDFAFDPNFRENSFFYVSYTVNLSKQARSRQTTPPGSVEHSVPAPRTTTTVSMANTAPWNAAPHRRVCGSEATYSVRRYLSLDYSKNDGKIANVGPGFAERLHGNSKKIPRRFPPKGNGGKPEALIGARVRCAVHVCAPSNPCLPVSIYDAGRSQGPAEPPLQVCLRTWECGGDPQLGADTGRDRGKRR